MNMYLFTVFYLILSCLMANPIMLNPDGTRYDGTPYEEPILSFETEQLVFTVNDSLWCFEGDFGFANYSKKDIAPKIFFPIVENSSMLCAENITIRIDQKKLEVIKTPMNEKGFWFVLPMEAKSFETVHISYQQTLKTKSGEYVLLSALSWGKPLAFASYTLQMPRGKKLIHAPFPDAKIKPNAEFDEYYWEFQNFVPEVNFIAKWE